MARPLRIEFENAWYHVMNRGVNKQNIFTTDKQRNLFCVLLKETVDQFKIEIHAFCLMSNHYHLLIKTPQGNLGAAMKHLNGLYVQKINASTGRDGPMFRGRYKAILIDSDEYLLQVSRYVHLNPVEANICKKPEEFAWSSYRAYIHKKYSIPWLTTGFTLEKFNGKNKVLSYMEFVEAKVNDDSKKLYYDLLSTLHKP